MSHGEFVMTQGDPGHSVFIVIEGEIKLTKTGHQHVPMDGENVDEIYTWQLGPKPTAEAVTLHIL